MRQCCQCGSAVKAAVRVMAAGRGALLVALPVVWSLSDKFGNCGGVAVGS